jgi:MerR family transcriptional regulator, mercuric resistance operon regulatory protein
MLNQGPSMSIGALATAAGVNVETIRFYERKGLLAKQSSKRPIRRYTAKDVSRVKFVIAAKGLGFTLNEIGSLLELEDGTHCHEVRDLAVLKLQDVRGKIAALQNLESALERAIAGCCDTEHQGVCHLIASLQATN